jgi:hypothetical protein
MTRATRFCRVAWVVEDMDSVVAELKRVLGLSMRFGSIATDIIKAGIEEHGLEPIQLFAPDLPFMRGLPAPLIEIALAVHDAEASKARMARDGLQPSVASFLPGPDRNEYLYAHGFHGLPVMVCTDGDNESLMAPFLDLEAAAPPKTGVVAMGVDSIDEVAALFTRYFDMQFVETDPAGLGARAVVGRHRVKLVEKLNPQLSRHFMRSLLAVEMMFDEHETIRRRLEAAGYPVAAERTFKSGRKGYYFGATISGLPLAIYSPLDDGEARGIT